MHRYQPRCNIIYLPPETNSQGGRQEQNYRQFIFKETSFTAVTAYQNQNVSFSFNI